MSTYRSFVDEGIDVVRGNREEVYGSPDQNFRTIALFWSAWLSVRLRVTVTIEPSDVAHMMVLLKEARIANSPNHRDNHVDIVGYMACLDQIQRRQHS